jgi:glycosyltransferase involved in cell wall biosynthesis
MKRVLFVTTTIVAFREKDLQILRRHFDVSVVSGTLGASFLLASVRRIIESDIVFSWFVTKRTFYFALLSKLFRKKYLLISGGNDVAEVPEIGYTFSFLTRLIVKLTLRLSDEILAFSESSKSSILGVAPKANVKTVYVGAIDTNYFKPAGEKEDLIVTVSHVVWSNVERKGLKTFVETAKYLPEKRFALIGEWEDDSIEYLRSISPPNVTFTGYLSPQQLLEFYQKAKVYVQVSAHEGFGIAVAEAMACECVPVVTKRAALPEVVGVTGYVVAYNDPKTTAQVVERALEDRIRAKEARKRVIELFTLERREQELKRTVTELAWA